VWYLFLLVTVGGSVLLVWDYRRKAAAREAASQERFEQIFNARSTAAVPELPVEAPVAVPAAPATSLSRERFLGRPETLVYRLLKVGLPDHDIFAHVALASIAVAPGTGIEREQQARRISQYHLDFVICDKNMRVVAAIELETAAGAALTGEQLFKANCLKAAGVSLVRINTTALPRRDAIRALILGQAKTAGS